MPVQTDIQLEDIGKAVVPTLIPLGIAGLGWYIYLKKKEQVEWFDKLKKPNWVSLVTNPRIQMPLDLVLLSPVGYAAHVVCKEGQGADRQLALSLYGAGLVTWLAGIPAFVHTKNLKCWMGVELLAAGIFGATAAAFYKVNKTSGALLVPVTAWLFYQGIEFFAIDQANQAPKQK